ncbi:MAG: hypothetical protein CO094_10160, partial [Anaerolineae bacterium CG_4_9_14_3_um_filter_57_17]
ILALIYTGGVIGVDLAIARLVLSLAFGIGILALIYTGGVIGVDLAIARLVLSLAFGIGSSVFEGCADCTATYPAGVV